MKFRNYVALFLIGIIASLGVATLESVPGYMDADYYYATGLRIADNNGWSEPFIWNYLDDPGGLPHPAYTYWMPLAGLLAGLSMKITGLTSFWGARIGFLLVAGCIGPLTAYLAYSFTPHQWAGLLAGVIAIFSGFYFAYLPTTETFGIYMLLGGIYFIIINKLQESRKSVALLADEAVDQSISSINLSRRLISPSWLYLLIGVIPGFMYLTRSDGLIWIILALVAIFLQGSNFKKAAGNSLRNRFYYWPAFLICIAGFLLVCSPLILRNISQFGSVFAPGSSKGLWLTVYDDLFSYPAAQLTFNRWVGSGILALAKVRGWALGLNLMNTAAVQGSIFALPLIFGGMWVHRKDWRVILGIMSWAMVILVMTLIFPFQGARGGFFHAGAALQPLLWALIPAGLLVFVRWGERNRNWDFNKSIRFFGYSSIVLVITITLFVSGQRLGIGFFNSPGWGKSELTYLSIEENLESFSAPPEAIVMVNNPPGYYVMTGREAIVIPNGEISVTLEAGKKYGAGYLVLDENFPDGLKDLYLNPAGHPGLELLNTVGEMHIFKMER